ncbi:DNA translocase FtsK [Helicobacter jaachi]|uniref:DNA translocase FtsK n=1 Tax=Helicobacter jaachi TaxID=1677920 RepID=A0A4U8TBQ8_9HELI|nr:DNA translocase FtsK [Helicobacter jaachi]TLD96057.1 DNA translocase FtsK [Helicobacter jaachi]
MLLFLSIATIIGDYGLVGNFGIYFATLNLNIFGYIAYVYLPLLLYPLFRFYKSPTITFRRLELIVSCSLFFIALLILQSLSLQQGAFGNAIVLFLKNYIGYVGVWVLDVFFFIFAWLIFTQRNIDVLLKQTKNKCLVAFDVIKHISLLLYALGVKLTKSFLAFIRPHIHNLFAKKTQDVLDLQSAAQERTKAPSYDFKDVLVERAFDEMAQSPNAAPNATNITHTPMPAVDSINTESTDSQNVSPTQADSINTNIQTNADTSASAPLLEIVESSQSDMNLEEFFKTQRIKHQDMLKNLKNQPHTALSQPAIELTESLKHTQANISQESTSSKSIPTPPPRPINPDVFLQSAQHTVSTNTESTSIAASSTQASIKEENIKAASHTKEYGQMLDSMQDKKSVQSTQADTQVPENKTTYDDNLFAKEMPFIPIPPLQQTPKQERAPHFANTESATDSIRVDSTNTESAHTESTNTQSTTLAQNSAQSTPMPQTLELDIKEITESNPTQWVDSIVQEIPTKEVPTQKIPPQAPHAQEPNHKPTHTRVTELAENKALLNNLEYGKVNKPLNFKLPSTSLLNQPLGEKVEIDGSEIDRKIEDLLSKLKMFRVEGDIARTYSGPIVTTFEFRPAPNVKVSKILTLEDDLAMALRAHSIRIQAPIPGKDVVGIEIPNNHTQTIYLREVLESDLFKTSTSPLTLALGKDIVGNPFITDLKKLPHLLIAGTTGSGKSVGINAMILSLLYKNSPDNLKLLMIDPKKVEFSIYADIPHLITPIITQPKKAIVGLNSAMAEMDRRYDLMSEMRTKDIDSYNRKVLSEGGEKFAYLVIIIDELADLMMTGGKEVEFALARIAQMGRACGIHIIVATQRPSVDVVTGLIKTNLPSRISYKVGSKIDSKVILDTFGAESLLGKGDMLFTPPGLGGVMRLHAPWNTEEEIEKVAEFLKAQQVAQYDKHFMLDERDNLVSSNADSQNGENSDLLSEAKNIILQDRKTSASYLQRRLSIGYNKAANLVEQLENEGFLSAPNIKGVREILGQ